MLLLLRSLILFAGLCLPFSTLHGQSKIAIAIHGGAGDLRRMHLSPEQEQAYTATLSAALDSGYAVLRSGGASTDAAIAAVRVLEDSPLFNAGRGAVLTSEGTIELDASIMEGHGHACGAVTGVTTVKNPILAANAVMKSGQVVFLAGRGAEQFAEQHGVEIVDTAYFFTPARRAQLQQAKNNETTPPANDSRGGVIFPPGGQAVEKFGTVGCVALDQYGNLAAATSTGGIVNKRHNRIGDSPVIGAGTYADNASCAVSCTGKGEDFIRLAVAHDIAARMRYGHVSLRKAARQVILESLQAIGGEGGCIALDRAGHIEMPFNTSGMFRGRIDTAGQKTVAIYAEQ